MKTAVIRLFALLLTLTMIVPGASPVLAADDQGTATTPGRLSLMIKAPEVAEVGQPVTITIFSKPQQKPVAQAALYALKINQLPVPTNKSNFDSIISSYTTAAKEKGIFLGNTGDDGIVKYKFTESNRYVLIAIKDGYVPGFSRISITPSPKKGLNIKAPNGTEAGKPVTLVVTERFTKIPVANAAIYAKFIREINVPIVLPLSPPVKVVPPSTSNVAPPSISPATPGTTGIITAKPTEAPRPAISAALSSIAPIIKANTADFEGDRKTAESVQQGGFLLGKTNDKGELVTTFKDDGIYMLAAIKENYAPGLAKIAVTLPQQKKLGIKAPGDAPVNTPVTLFVLERPEGKPVANAKVFALRITDEIVSANRPFETIYKDENIGVYMREKYQTIIREKGIFIGETSADGQLTYSFTEKGWYVLTALKDGYLPGFHRIDIDVAGKKVLDIKAPPSSPTGQAVTITVFDRQTQNVVEKAGVYAVKVNAIPVPPTTGNSTASQKIIVGEPSNVTEAEQYVTLAKQKGIYLGETGKSGTVAYTFNDPALFILVATKDDFRPGFSRINVLSAKKALLMDAPIEAFVGEAVSIIVKERYSNARVGKAAIYGIKMETVIPSVEPLLKNDPLEADIPAREKFTSAVRERGSLLGWTDDNGLLQYKFPEWGHYILVAVKDGYLPDFDRIYIKPLRPTTTN